MLPITVMAVSGMIEKSVAHNPEWITGLGVGIHLLYFMKYVQNSSFCCFFVHYTTILPKKQAIHKCILFEIARGKEHDKDYDS